MDPLSLEKSLKKGEVSAVTLFLAEEPYWVDRLTDTLRQALRKRAGSFQEIRFEGKDWTLDSLLSEINAFSMFSSMRLIRVLEAERIKKGEWGRLQASLLGNASVTLMLITQKKETFREATKVLGDLAVEVVCEKPKPRDLPTLVLSFAKEEGKTMGMGEARSLIEFSGTDLILLRNQITLLSLFVGGRERIAEKDIQDLFSESADKNVFDLTKALAEEDIEKGFRLLKSLLNQGEAPIRLLALLARHYRLVFRTKLMLRRGSTGQEMAQALRLPPFVVEQYVEQAHRLSWKKAIAVFQALFQTDRALKSSPVPQANQLERFLWGCFKN